MPSLLPAPGEPNVLYVIDLSGYVFRAYHAIAPLSSSKGEPTHAVMGTVNMLQRVVNGRKPAMLAVAMDSRGPTFRSDLDPRYKAHRPPPPPDLGQQMERCREIVHAYRIPIFKQDGLEADDLIATCVRRAREDGVRVVVVSADKDLMQLVADDGDDVLMWDSMRDKVYGPAEVKEKFGVKPSQLRDLLALTGDTSDNVPGVPGVGPKTATELLTTYGTLEEVLAHAGEVKRPKLREALQQNVDEARLSQALVTLRTDCVLHWDLAELRYGGADVPELRRLFAELEFHRLHDALGKSMPTVVTAAPNAEPKALSAAASLDALTAVQSTRVYSASNSTVSDIAFLAKATLVADLESLHAVLQAAQVQKRLAISVFASSTAPVGAALVGIALCASDDGAMYLPLSHRYLGVSGNANEREVLAILTPALSDPSVTLVGHALKRSISLLAERGLVVKAKLFDVEVAAYLLDPEAPHGVAALAQRDLAADLPLFGFPDAKGKLVGIDLESTEVERAALPAGSHAHVAYVLSQTLAERLQSDGLLELANEVEFPLMSVLAAMEREGILVDVEKLHSAGKRIEGELATLDVRAKELAGHDFSLRSRDQLEKILFDELRLPVLKKTPKGGRSTDAEVLEELKSQHPLPGVICEYRELDKLKGTYLDALPRYVSPVDGRIHTRFDQLVAATGRLSSIEPNLQNIPIRTEAGREIRAAFVPRPGYLFLSADYSQIELRVLAHLSADPELMRAFAGDDDVHRYTASLIFEVAQSDVTPEMRRQAKTINFGVIYGMGDSALGKQLGISKDQAARFIKAYFLRYAGVAAFMEKTVETARKGEAVRTMLGRRRFLPNLHSGNRGVRLEAERIAKNTPIQGTAADILKLAMVRLGRTPPSPGAKMLLSVHDELVFEIPEAEVEQAKPAVVAAMAGAATLRVELVVTVGVGPNWRAAH